MAIPMFKYFILPTLMAYSDRQEHQVREVMEWVADKLELTEEDKEKGLASGGKVYSNRVYFSVTYLKQAGLLRLERQGVHTITEEGLKALESKPEVIDHHFLNQYPSFVEFRNRKKAQQTTTGVVTESAEATDELTPQEKLEAGYQTLHEELAGELLEQVMNCSPRFFEGLVIDVLLAMGYGGSRSEAGSLTSRGSDEGIDGIIKEDKLGLDVIYVQAKKWTNDVSRPEVQKFAGALQGQRAKKGIFITTSSFTDGAREFVKNIDSKIVLIDGERLAKLMIEHNVGVSVSQIYELKKLDSDYFV